MATLDVRPEEVSSRVRREADGFALQTPAFWREPYHPVANCVALCEGQRDHATLPLTSITHDLETVSPVGRLLDEARICG